MVVKYRTSTFDTYTVQTVNVFPHKRVAFMGTTPPDQVTASPGDVITWSLALIDVETNRVVRINGSADYLISRDGTVDIVKGSVRINNGVLDNINYTITSSDINHVISLKVRYSGTTGIINTQTSVITLK